MAAKTATYKGKTYLLKFLGATKFGQRAKLAFMDGSKEFWVEASAVSAGGSVPTARRGGRSGGGCGGHCPVRGHWCTAANPCHDCE